MTLGQPGVGSKEGPAPEAVAEALKRKLENDPPLTLEQFWNMAKNAGAQFMGLESDEGGTTIAIKGTVKGRTCEASIYCKEGDPFRVYSRSVLESFRQGQESRRVERVTEPEPIDQGGSDFAAQPFVQPDVPTAGPPPVVIGVEQPGYAAAVERQAVERKLRREHEAQPTPQWPADNPGMNPPTDGGGHGTSTTSTTPDMPTEFRQHSSNIKKQDGTSQHRHVPGAKPPGAAGMCVQCEVQPTQHPGSQFCGGACAKQWHMNKIAKQRGINLSRIK